MKKYITSFFVSLLAVSALVSCGDLELDQSVYHNKKYLFSDFGRVKEVMTNVYGYVESGFYSFHECASDDAVYANSPDVAKIYYDGSWSANNVTSDDKWSHYYAGIRAANYLIENCPEDFEIARYDDNYKYLLAQLQLHPWEAKALRAYYHMELLKRYKNIVIADKTYTTEEVNKLLPATYSQAVNWIAAELKAAAEKLPDTYENTSYAEIGRVTRGFALAARARLLLYAASPLNNASGDKKLYVAAAAAAQDFFNTVPKTTFVLADQKFNVECKDLIFGRREGTNNTFESNNFPVGYEGGKSGTCPTLNLVEAFDMKDGTPFNFEKHKDALLNSSMRDPRFAKAILSNGDIFKGVAVETFVGGQNGMPKENASPTSFYLRKFVQEATSLTTGNVSKHLHLYPIFRLEEVYLNYAEALFEATGSSEYTGTLDGTSFSMSPRAALNAIRKVYGMPEIPAGLSADDFRKRLRNERRVELCFEGHRFWDLRRWKEGEKTKEIYGLSIVKGTDDTYTVEKVLVQTRYWNDKQYWYPLSNTEYYKNQNLIQNTGW